MFRVLCTRTCSSSLTLAIAPTASSQPSRAGAFEAAFGRESYGPGEQATLAIWNSPARISVQIFRTGPERVRTRGTSR